MGLCGHRRNPHLGNLQFPEQNGVSTALSCMVRHQSIACAPRLRNRGDLQPGRPQIKTAAAYWRGDFVGADFGVYGLPAGWFYHKISVKTSTHVHRSTSSIKINMYY